MSDSKKRKKSYYVQAKRSCKGRPNLDIDFKGFLITCANNCDKRVSSEALNILNEYADKLYGEVVKCESSPDSSEEIDFDKAIAQQVNAEKSVGKKGSRFQIADAKTTNCVFVKTSLEHPDELLHHYLSDVAATGVTKSRFILKIFPVLGTCRAQEEKIEKLVEVVLQSWIAAGNSFSTYAILYKVRCNNLSREQLLPIVGRAIHAVCFECRVDLNAPDVIVSVDVLGKFCCVSVMKDFYKLRKYNVQELCKLKSTSGGATTAVVAGDASAVNCSQSDGSFSNTDVSKQRPNEQTSNATPVSDSGAE